MCRYAWSSSTARLVGEICVLYASWEHSQVFVASAGCQACIGGVPPVGNPTAACHACGLGRSWFAAVPRVYG